MYRQEDFLNNILVESSLTGFYFRQFFRQRRIIPDDFYSFGSPATNLTATSSRHPQSNKRGGMSLRDSEELRSDNCKPTWTPLEPSAISEGTKVDF